MNPMDFLRFTKRLKAKALLPDDWFRMGGEIYRVTSTVVHPDTGMVEIDFKPRNYPRNSGVFFMTVARNTKFKIYNQK